MVSLLGFVTTQNTFTRINPNATIRTSEPSECNMEMFRSNSSVKKTETKVCRCPVNKKINRMLRTVPSVFIKKKGNTASVWY